MTSQVLAYNQMQQSPKGYLSYIDALDNAAKQSAIGAIPFFRRGMSIEEKSKNHDYLGLAGSGALIAINAPEDWRDIKSSVRQLRGAFDPNYKYDPRPTSTHSRSFAVQLLKDG